MILKGKEQGEWIKLINVAEGYELDLICSMLAELDIPVQKKSRGAGAYTSIFMGLSITGFDIYVPANRLIEAKEILENVEPVNPEMLEPMDTESIDTEIRQEGDPDGYILNNRSFFKELFILIIVVPTVLGLLYALFQILKDAVG